MDRSMVDLRIMATKVVHQSLVKAEQLHLHSLFTSSFIPIGDLFYSYQWALVITTTNYWIPSDSMAAQTIHLVVALIYHLVILFRNQTLSSWNKSKI